MFWKEIKKMCTWSLPAECWIGATRVRFGWQRRSCFVLFFFYTSTSNRLTFIRHFQAETKGTWWNRKMTCVIQSNKNKWITEISYAGCIGLYHSHPLRKMIGLSFTVHNDDDYPSPFLSSTATCVGMCTERLRVIRTRQYGAKSSSSSLLFFFFIYVASEMIYCFHFLLLHIRAVRSFVRDMKRWKQSFWSNEPHADDGKKKCERAFLARVGAAMDEASLFQQIKKRETHS